MNEITFNVIVPSVSFAFIVFWVLARVRITALSNHRAKEVEKIESGAESNGLALVLHFNFINTCTIINVVLDSMIIGFIFFVIAIIAQIV